MYRYKKPRKSSINTSDLLVEGETIEHKVNRILTNKEPITDGAPEIFTERNEGVLAGYNPRTDRFEVAVEAMTKIEKSRTAKTIEKPKGKEESKVIKMDNKDVSGAESTVGEQQ